MSNKANFLDITLLGKEYRVACPQEEHAALLAAVSYVDGKMRDIADKTKSNAAERIAVMAALNIAHEYLSLEQQMSESSDTNQAAGGAVAGLDFGAIRRRISNMEAKLDAVLTPQATLL